MPEPCIVFYLQQLDRLPSIKTLSLMKTKSFHANPSIPALFAGPLTQLGNHGLKRINFGDSDDWGLETKVDIAMLLEKSQKNLRGLYTTKPSACAIVSMTRVGDVKSII